MAARHLKLSRREYEVLMWAARGKTYADIGLILNLSFGTVKSHLDSMRLKLRANNLPQAIAIAFATGLITAEEFSQRTTLSDFAEERTSIKEADAQVVVGRPWSNSQWSLRKGTAAA
jgi:DNA-binding CsgD family transcriptional regulator